jgi:ACS family D-galactonate transporter-like MFS transporter
MPAGRQPLSSMSRPERIIVGLLVASVFVNYIDRANLSIAAPVLQWQLKLSSLQIGSLLSAFFWTYAFLQLFGVAGWIVDRFPVGRVFAWGYISWCAATIATGFTSGFIALYAVRLLLGMGESVTYPCYSRIFAELPEHHRGRANAFIDAGTKVGPGIGTFVGGFLLIHFGWRMMFIVLGAGALVWLLPWIRLMPHSRWEITASAEPLPPTTELLRVPSAWGTFLGQFCGNYFYYFLLTWLPIYFVRERNLSLGAMTRLTSALFLGIACATLTAGWIADHLIGRGISTAQVRRTFAVGGLLVASSIVPFAFIDNLTGSVVLLTVACLGHGAYAANHWAIGQTLAGPTMAGRWSSIQNGVANLAGIVAPSVAGIILHTRGSLRLAFSLVGAVSLAGALIWYFMVPRVEPVKWKKKVPAAAV